MTDVRAIPNEPDLEPAPPATTRPRTNGHKAELAPHDLHAERSLLGAMMLAPTAVDIALQHVDARAFYAPAHSAIYTAIIDMAATGAPTVDSVTVAHHLDQTGQLQAIGGPAVLAAIMAETPASSAAASYARIVAHHARTRAFITAGHELAETARTRGPDAAYELLRPLLDDHQPGGTTLEWEDVAAVVRGDYDPLRPTILTRTDGQALVYPGLLHWIHGEPGKGKTWVALAITAEQLVAGHHVLYLDWEGNRRTTGERLASLGVAHHQVEAGLHYLRPPAITRPIAAAIAAIAHQHEATVAICDGVAKALARNDFNEDKAPDVLAWLELLVTPLVDVGTAVVCLDHVAKDKDTRGAWARGSGAKIGEVSGASWYVKPRTPFSRKTAGEIDLVQTKDREGHVGVDGAIVARLRITPSDGGAHVDIQVHPPVTDGAVFRPTRFMQQVSQALEKLNADGIAPTVNQLLTETPGKKEHKRAALDCLLAEGYVTRAPGPNRSIRLTSDRPYRELDDPDSDSYSPLEDRPEEPGDDPTDPPVWEEF